MAGLQGREALGCSSWGRLVMLVPQVLMWNLLPTWAPPPGVYVLHGRVCHVWPRQDAPRLHQCGGPGRLQHLEAALPQSLCLHVPGTLLVAHRNTTGGCRYVVHTSSANLVPLLPLPLLSGLVEASGGGSGDPTPEATPGPGMPDRQWQVHDLLIAGARTEGGRDAQTA